MKKGFTKITDPEVIDLTNNKYFFTVILSYYMISRDKDIEPAMKDFETDSNLKSIIFQEYIRYLAGFDVTVEQDYEQDKGQKLSIPDYPAFKLSQIMNTLKAGTE